MCNEFVKGLRPTPPHLALLEAVVARYGVVALYLREVVGLEVVALQQLLFLFARKYRVLRYKLS